MLVDILVDSRPIVDYVTVAKFVAASLVSELTRTHKKTDPLYQPTTHRLSDNQLAIEFERLLTDC